MQQNNSDGYIENDQLHANDTNNFDEFTSRAQLRWTPSDTAQYDLSANYFDADNGYDTWSLDNTRTTFSDQPGKDKQQIKAFTGAGNWLLDDTHSLDASAQLPGCRPAPELRCRLGVRRFLRDTTCAPPAHDTAQEIFDRKRDRWVADVRLLGGAEVTLPAALATMSSVCTPMPASEHFDYLHPSLWYGDAASSSDYDTNRYAAIRGVQLQPQ